MSRQSLCHPRSDAYRLTQRFIRRGKNTGGNIERFIVPFSSIPDMQRPGSSDYQINVGAVDMRNVDDSSHFTRVSYSRGVNNYLTASAGGIWSQNYQSLLLGGAVSIPYAGSLSASVEESQYRLHGDSRRHGEKYALSGVNTSRPAPIFRWLRIITVLRITLLLAIIS